METRKVKTKVVATVLALAGLAVFSMFAVGGSLEPSAPPGPTMKTLDEVEPRIPVQSLSGSANAVYVIDQPGSYYFTGDVNIVAADKHGIIVEVNDVTIDLMGYTLKGPDSWTGDGIYMNGRSNVEIRNGTVRDFGSYGIREAGTTGKGHRVISVRMLSNSLHGILLAGSGYLVKDCTAVENGDTGIYAGSGCTITGNTAYNNGTIGIFAYYCCTVTGNTAYQNGNHGIYAYYGCTVTGNTAYYNQYNGILLGGNSLVDQNTAYNNNQSGGSYPNISACSTCTFGTNHAP